MNTTMMPLDWAVLMSRAYAIERERQRIEHRRDSRRGLSPETREALTRAAARLYLAAHDRREAAERAVDG